MFVGHYSAAMIAKAAEPRAPLWVYAVACQAVDIGWSVFIMTGVEHVRIDQTLPGSVFDLYDMPYTHSLPGSLAWAVAGALLARFALRLPSRASAIVGLVVFSHWILDLLVHRPDLALWFGGPKVGFALWNYPAAEMALEMGLVAVAAVIWAAARKSAGAKAWPVVAFAALLTVLQMGQSWPGTMLSSLVALGVTALALYAVVAIAAAFADRGSPATRRIT